MARQGRMRLLTRSSEWLLLVALLAALVPAGLVSAQTTQQPSSPWETADRLRKELFAGQAALLTDDTSAASSAVERAEAIWSNELQPTYGADAGRAAELVSAGFRQAGTATGSADAAGLVVARSTIWSGLLLGAADLTVAAAENGDAEAAQRWLLLRAYIPATRISRPGAEATLAVQALADGRLEPADAAEAVRADLLHTYQALALSALDEMLEAGNNGASLRQAESAALAAGYWRIVAESYGIQHGEESRLALDQQADSLAAKALSDPAALPDIADSMRQELRRFQASPMTDEAASRRANQLLRFLSLVPFEYRQGVKDGHVMLALEIEEAITFRDGAAAAFNDLASALYAIDAERAATVDKLLRELDADLQGARDGSNVADSKDVDKLTNTLTSELKDLFPSAWDSNASGTTDFDTINSLLDELESSISAGKYGQAESLRLEAYAVFDLGPEVRLIGLAPGLAARIEGYFWHGHGGTSGLASLIAKRASLADIQASRQTLDGSLAEADARLGAGPPAHGAIVFNSAIIVFREGLEAVLIFASLLASLIGARRVYRRPMVLGAVLAGVATLITWVLFGLVLSSLRRYGERLEAVVSLIAVAVLLLILNWFLHDAYWSRWIRRFHGRKRSLVGAAAGQTIGFILMGFTSIYREGFETTLFLQALVLDAGTVAVLEGVALGLLGTVAIGFLVFKVQAKLPYKRMLILTGLLITAVLMTMVGNTVHLFQAVGWMPINLIDGVQFPYWAGVWLGLYPTWEGIIAQFLSGAFVISSYFIAEELQARERRRTSATSLATPSATTGGDD
jgi:high-affinity iron transporter